MLARAARRKLRRDAFQSPTHLSGQLWQRPAQIRCTASTNSIYTPSDDSRKQRIPPLLASRHEIRSLTTTAELQPSPSQASINGFMRPWAPQAHSSGLSTLQPWDPANPLVLRDSYQAPFTNFNYGIGGDPSELYQNLYACLRVGRMDRAFAIIQRLTRLYEPSAPELTEAHNVYLQTMFELAQQDPKLNSLTEIGDFFDNRIVRQAIEPNAQTFVTLLRAAMNFLEEEAQVNAIRRYLAMAHEYSSEMVQEINCAPEFSDEEWDLLLRLQPDTFEEPPPIEQIQEIQISTPAGRKSLIEHGLLPGTVYSIKPVPQKGMGLKTLKSALTSFDYAEEVPYPHEMEGTREEKDLAYNQARQLRLEQDSLKAAIARWKAEDEKLQEMGIHGVLKTKNIQALMWNWYSALLPRVQEEIKKVKEVLANPTPENRTDDRHVYGPWLERSEPAKVAAITISRVIVGCAQDSNDESGSATLKISTLASRISRDIEQTHNQSEKQRRDQFIRKRRLQARTELIDKLAKIKTSLDNTQAQKPEGDAQTFEQFTRTEFPLSVRTKIGALALDLLLQTAKITVTAEDPQTGKQLTCTQAAFQHRTGFAAGKRVGWVSPHKEVLHKLRTDPVHKIETIKMPMVFEPKPWTSSSSGGYYTYNSHVVRSKSGDQAQRAYTQSALENGDMKKVLEGLNVLGKVPWQINKEVFEVMAQVWNSGEGLGGLIPEEPDLERPEEPPADASYKERTGWASKIKEYENIKSGLHSQRCFQNFQLEIARGFLKEKKIYFPHSVDFRGRAYPIPPLLNHIGSDISRGLLKFANGKELGTVGLQWLKVHLANLYGYDKASLREREQFAMDNMNEIYDSATNPLNGRRWWVKAEDPWQCLACCMELKNALDSPDPTRYVSQLPVHQDGTCNGLQHYAALGGDLAGATQVNLEPSDRPQDIYTGVATLVAEMVAEEAAKGDPRAQLMDGKITRKIVKRTVMTNVYGVTFMGAKAQVLTELKDIFPNFKESESVKNLAQVALYIAHKIFSALGKIFNGAQEIQYWLGECGNRITTSISADQVKKMQERMAGVPVSTYGPQYQKPPRQNLGAVKKMNKQVEAFKTSIIWTTPLKMPVVQPYRRDATQVIKTPLQDINVYSRTTSHTVNKRKQLQAFPPNFIHSLDASHMLLSALKCSELGLDFAAVHDSFWTHAADIPNMNTVLREAFVRMHSEDIVSRLAAEFKARYAGSMYRANLQYKSAVAQKIVAWRQEHCKEAGIAPKRASFREASFTEVALEATRQELLNSDDPVKRKEGEEMVTPTSIWLAEQDMSTLTSHRLELLGEMKEKSDQTVEPVDVFNDDDLDDNSKPEPKRSQWEVYVWLPLTFPPVPKKGGWDVSRLRESKYFFS